MGWGGPPCVCLGLPHKIVLGGEPGLVISCTAEVGRGRGWGAARRGHWVGRAQACVAKGVGWGRRPQAGRAAALKSMRRGKRHWPRPYRGQRPHGSAVCDGLPSPSLGVITREPSGYGRMRQATRHSAFLPSFDARCADALRGDAECHPPPTCTQLTPLLHPRLETPPH